MKPIILNKAQTFENHTFTQPIIIKHPGVVLKNCTSKDVKGGRWKSIAVEILCDNYTLEGHTVDGGEICYILDGFNNSLINCVAKNFTEDVLRITKNGAVVRGNFFSDYLGPKAAHKDFIQMYGGMQVDNNGRKVHYSHKERFLGLHTLRDIIIEDNILMDDSSVLQGIFSSDGMLDNISIRNNFISLPNANHSISLRGCHGPVGVAIENNFVDGPKIYTGPMRKQQNHRWVYSKRPLNVSIKGNHGL